MLACPCNYLLMRHLQLQKYLALPQKGKIIAEYVWIDGSNGIRSKSRVSNFSRSTSWSSIGEPRGIQPGV